jgi:hypothetical protein
MNELRDYTLIVDKSGSMATADQTGNRTRWTVMQESAFALASHCEAIDPDGITLYLFAGRFKRYDRVTAARVTRIFQENAPAGSTDLAGVLQHAFTSYFERRTHAGEANSARGETFLVVTDGEPDDRRAVMEVIVGATKKLRSDTELGVSFIQVGRDPAATRFLKVLDDDLVRAGAKFDICDTLTLDDMEDTPLTDVLLNALHD